MSAPAYEQAVEALRRYCHVPDADHALFALAVATVADRDGPPLWGLIVGPPSCGKTEVIRALDDVADGRLDEVTAAGLLSWTGGKRPRPTSDHAGGRCGALGRWRGRAPGRPRTGTRSPCPRESADGAGRFAGAGSAREVPAARVGPTAGRGTVTRRGRYPKRGDATGGGQHHPASLRNLRPARTPGVEPRLSHGAYSQRLVAHVESEVGELMDALGDAAPIREADGTVPAADLAAVEAAARALKRWRHVSAWCDAHGRIQERTGRVKPAAELELACERALHRALDALGMNPASRVALGVGVARQSLDLAQLMAQHREARGG